MALSRFFRVSFRISLVLLLLLPALSIAEVISLRTAGQLTAEAELLSGDNDASPILILHGFLQTRDFPTVSRLANALHEAGHTVLTPSLTLGLDRRRKSLACEAIHTHNVDMDTTEIAGWINWLHEKTGRPVTLIGHSAGTQTLLSHLERVGDANIHKAIFISLSYFAQGPSSYETPADAERARANLANGRDPLETYSLAFCKQYPTRASDFLSYYAWDRDKIARLTSRFSDLTSVIIGTGDKRIENDWREQLRNKRVRVIEIEGANHFFDQAHEFDLLEAIEELLEQRA